MRLSLADNVIVAGANNCPHMLDKTQYSSWASRMLLYIKGKEYGKLLFNSVLNGPFKYGTVTVPRAQTPLVTVRDKTYDELIDAEKLCESCDIKATNIYLLGLPQDIYNLMVQGRQTQGYAGSGVRSNDIGLSFKRNGEISTVGSAKIDDVDAFDSDCDDAPSTKAVLMVNLSSYDSNALSEEFFHINEWQAKLDVKNVSIAKLKKHIENLKGKNMVDKDAMLNDDKVIAPRMFKLDLEPLAPKVLKNKDAHINYIKNSQEHADTLQEIFENARAFRPLDSNLNSAYQVISSTSASGSKPSGNTKRNGISRPTSSNQKNKVVKIVHWYMDSGCSKQVIGNRSQLINFVYKFMGTIRFRNDQITKIMGYGDYQLGNVTISRVYYVKGRGTICSLWVNSVIQILK
nr:integrase, catalytic region, zinc finger, CCHC-type, peptidase aspartic, catalytic [Tanacetum cinerariifolium]